MVLRNGALSQIIIHEGANSLCFFLFLSLLRTGKVGNVTFLLSVHLSPRAGVSARFVNTGCDH